MTHIIDFLVRSIGGWQSFFQHCSTICSSQSANNIAIHLFESLHVLIKRCMLARKQKQQVQQRVFILPNVSDESKDSPSFPRQIHVLNQNQEETKKEVSMSAKQHIVSPKQSCPIWSWANTYVITLLSVVSYHCT